MCYKNKLERDLKKEAEEQLKEEVDSMNHQHRIKMKMIKEKEVQSGKNAVISQKAYESYLK